MSGDQNSIEKGYWLERLCWLEAERLLTAKTVVVLPLGAAAKQLGPHLPLDNDALIANWLADEIVQRLPVVAAPLINASFYPAFVEYAGSISLRAETARDLLIDCCRSLASFGVASFYVLNTGVSTERPLTMAKQVLEAEGYRFEYLKLSEAFNSLASKIFVQG